MPISELGAVERVARVLAGLKLSANAEGYEPSASDAVEDEWQLYIEQAVSILKTLREPDIVMANAGDPTFGARWSRPLWMTMKAAPRLKPRTR